MIGAKIMLQCDVTYLPAVTSPTQDGASPITNPNEDRQWHRVHRCALLRRNLSTRRMGMFHHMRLRRPGTVAKNSVLIR
jgi:hypothetical protein